MGRLLNRFKQDVAGIFYLSLAVLIGFALFSYEPADPSFNSIGRGLAAQNYCGLVGSFLADGLYQLFGFGAWLWVFALAKSSITSFRGKAQGFRSLNNLWATLFLFIACTLLAVYLPHSKFFQDQIYVGGLVGLGMAKFMVQVFNSAGVQIILWAGLLVLTVFYSEKSLRELFAVPLNSSRRGWSILRIQFKNALAKKTKPASIQEKPKPAINKEAFFPLVSEPVAPKPVLAAIEISEANPERRKVVLKAKVPQRIENWDLPKLSLLEDPPATRVRIDEKEIKRKAELLKQKLSHFSVTGEVVAARPGPAVTLFEFKPDADVKLSKITELADDLSLALSSESLRIIAPIPGRDVVGIETSNSQRETVYLKDMLADEEFWRDEIKLPMALGKQVDGEPKIVDLRKLPHLMVAGTTGSGKSVFTVSTITGFLFKHSPKTLRLILIDPKQVDLAAFEKLPHLLMPVVTDSKQAVNALKWAVREMEKRYKSMSEFGARGLEAYNESVSRLSKSEIEAHEKINQELESTPGKKSDQYYYSPLPYIVVVIEEFGDLMTVDKANVEISVVRLAQKARACGIHLMLAMQSPRKEVVTGLIKTNIPGRISFKVSSSMDSRIILDDTGAERLLAQGDMLFRNPGGANLIRHHGPFLKDAEITELAKFWSDQAEPQFDEAALKAVEGSSGDELVVDSYGSDTSEYDERYDEILSWASAQKEVSASLIQRRFQLGYPRAARLIETFEREGVVGPANGSKPRQVLINSMQHLDK